MSVNSLTELIDCKEDDFKEFCKDKNVGYLLALHNSLQLLYNQVSDTTKDLVNKSTEFIREGKSVPKDYVTTIEGLHSKLLIIEHRVFLVRGLLDKRYRS